MPKAFQQHITPLLSLFLAIYFLNFSIDAPRIEVKNAIGISEVENIIALILDLNLDLNQTESNHDDCQKEVEKEASADSFDIFHCSQSLALEHSLFSTLHLKHAHQLSITGRIVEITSPPPQS